MGLLDGKTALIFGVANDHSIAWGIARALHAEGAEVGFSSVESLIEKRVRPLAESIGSTFVEPCDVSSDEQIAGVFARWGETHASLDILVHALAFILHPPHCNMCEAFLRRESNPSVLAIARRRSLITKAVAMPVRPSSADASRH